MFLEKYLNKFYFELIVTNYDENYLRTLSENNFIEVYQCLHKHGFYFINDMIVNYLEIFEAEPKELEQALNQIKNKLGDNYVLKIGDNMTILSDVIHLIDTYSEKDD